MLLAVNVGNTNTVLGVFRGAELMWQWRMSTEPERTADELAVMFGGLLEQHDLSFSRQITGVVIASVVPTATGQLRDMVDRYFHFAPVVVGPGTRTGISILTDNPREVGADRIVNALAAFDRYGGPCIVIDFGTATTYDAVSEKGEFLGGAIAGHPGFELVAVFDDGTASGRGVGRAPLGDRQEHHGSHPVGTRVREGSWAEGMIARMRAEIGDHAKIVGHRRPRAARCRSALRRHRRTRSLAHARRTPPRLREERRDR